ncbi:hypothetical protein [Spirilliplanes yamanashiensis]|uniref:Uncharacterized protein n=1 Tax=Spirilliplanes yamanashiensis TaxID=42233 RepID=A0A8J3YD13_9ACTN|nr:hypothetical protein [Spirilliplanes yamanashiensis]MDP9816195.1 hypothetical protein [Spirilliplanes yamanashiensis]GIJ05720.1 hypothetical protein Sya03_50720 [Spirilliplanes yamanashiensis]
MAVGEPLIVAGGDGGRARVTVVGVTYHRGGCVRSRPPGNGNSQLAGDDFPYFEALAEGETATGLMHFDVAERGGLLHLENDLGRSVGEWDLS